MRVDLAIVGAGTAGAALAYLAAKRGLRVVCIERRPRGEAGARWVNGVPRWTFEEAGIPLPLAPELRGEGHAFHLVAGWGPERVVLTEHGVLEVDMRKLVERLQLLALEAGAELRDDTRVGSIHGDRIETSRGPIEADVIADASGLAGARLLDQPRVVASDLCAAAQEVRKVLDVEKARAFFEKHAVKPGDTLCFTGVSGGYSILNVRLDEEGLSLLTGGIPGDGHESGREILDRFVAQHDFIGEPLFGGSRAIPLRRPLDRIANDRIALVGDAACQVFSAHGSGIGSGLVAARVLADTLAEGRSPYQYAVRWHRRWGGLFAGYDAFRRFSQKLSTQEIRRMMSVGLLDEAGARAGLEQRLPRPEPRFLKGALRGAVSARGLTLDLLRALGKTAVAHALYARYPERAGDLPRWSERVAKRLD
jgi:flavin-dependent dehydrogenase